MLPQDDLAISSYQAAEAQKRLADLKSQRASEVRVAACTPAAITFSVQMLVEELV